MVRTFGRTSCRNQLELTDINKFDMKMKRTIKILMIGVPVLAVFAIAVSRQCAIAQGDAYMRAHLPES